MHFYTFSNSVNHQPAFSSWAQDSIWFILPYLCLGPACLALKVCLLGCNQFHSLHLWLNRKKQKCQLFISKLLYQTFFGTYKTKCQMNKELKKNSRNGCTLLWSPKLKGSLVFKWDPLSNSRLEWKQHLENRKNKKWNKTRSTWPNTSPSLGWWNQENHEIKDCWTTHWDLVLGGSTKKLNDGTRNQI